MTDNDYGEQARRILIVDDLDTVEYSVEGMLNRHPGSPPFVITQVTNPGDIAAATRLLADGERYALALVDLDFGAHRVADPSGHGLTALRLLAEHSPDTAVALYTADVEHNRELMLRAAFELSPHPPMTWISKATARFTQAEHICALLAGRALPTEHLHTYLNRPDPLRLPTVCGTRTQLRLWQAMALGFENRDQIAGYAHTAKSTLDKFVARVREFILDCTPATHDLSPTGTGKSANLQLACRFAYVNRVFFCEPELERIIENRKRRTLPLAGEPNRAASPQAQRHLLGLAKLIFKNDGPTRRCVPRQVHKREANRSRRWHKTMPAFRSLWVAESRAPEMPNAG